jgi:pyruvate-formate lyase-activating enzyme
MDGGRFLNCQSRRRLAYFIPGRGCTRRCVYCDQLAITRDAGGDEAISPEAVREVMKSLSAPSELCFFGGSFARLGPETVSEFLDTIWSAPDGSTVTFSSYPGDFDGEYGKIILDIV